MIPEFDANGNLPQRIIYIISDLDYKEKKEWRLEGFENYEFETDSFRDQRANGTTSEMKKTTECAEDTENELTCAFSARTL